MSQAGEHTFSKDTQPPIRLVAGLDVDGDAHAERTVKHRSRARRDPSAPPAGHLIHAELHDELRARGFTVDADEMGDNVTTRGLDLLGLPVGTRLRLGAEAVVEVTGLRNPCVQLDDFQPGLLMAVLDRAPDGSVVRKASLISVVLVGGEVRARDPIAVEPPTPPHEPLSVV